MQARRAILETDENGRLNGLPALPPCARVEVIFLYTDAGSAASVRKPPSELARLEITGDVIAPVIDLQDWNLGT
jgi:hypothetical protein